MEEYIQINGHSFETVAKIKKCLQKMYHKIY